jgi:hypothetical protein
MHKEQYTMTEEAVVLPNPKKNKKPPVEKVERPAKVTQNGQSRPGGLLTGKVWEIADALTLELGRPALRKEVWSRYKREVKNAQESTSNTQYGRWVRFNNYSDQIRDVRAKMRDEDDAAEESAEGQEEASQQAPAA